MLSGNSEELRGVVEVDDFRGTYQMTCMIAGTDDPGTRLKIDINSVRRMLNVEQCAGPFHFGSLSTLHVICPCTCEPNDFNYNLFQQLPHSIYLQV